MNAELATAKPHSGLSENDARKVAEVLVCLAKRDGKVTPEAFLEAATPTDSPIHDLFEWNDTVAAVSHRLHQARQIVRSVIFRPVRTNVLPDEMQLTPARIEARRSIAAKFTPTRKSVVHHDFPASSSLATLPATLPGKAREESVQRAPLTTSSSVKARERYLAEIREIIAHPASSATFEDLARAVWDAGYTFARLTEGHRDTSYDDNENWLEEID